MKKNTRQDINAKNNNVMLDEDDEFIVEYRNGEVVSEEYDDVDVAMEIEKDYYEKIEYEDTNYETDDNEDYDEDYSEEDDASEYEAIEYEDIDYEDTEAEDVDYEDAEVDSVDYEDAETEHVEYEDTVYDDIEYAKEDDFDTSFQGINGQNMHDSFDEYDEYDSYDGYEDEYGDDNGNGVVAWFKKALSSITVFDAVLGGTGIVLAVAVIVIISMFFQSKSTDKQVASIVPLGEELSEMGIVGSDGLLAMSSSASNGVFNDLVFNDEEISTIDVSDESQSSKVSVSFTSVEKDLKIRFTDADTGALITGTAFEVTLTDSKGKKTVLTDDDMDGLIYVESIAAGTYDAVITSTDKYKFPSTSQQVTVKDKVQYVVVNNIQDEVKTEKQVNVAVEDTQINNAAQEEETLKDTVEWVEASKTAIGGSESYLLVDKSTITDPSQVSKLASRMLFDTINVSLDKTSLDMTVGDSTKLSGTEFNDKDEDDKTYSYKIEWTSSDSSVASVDGGTVTAKATGTAKITYKVTETVTSTTTTYEEITEEQYNENDENMTREGEEGNYIYKKKVVNKETTTNEGSAQCEVTVKEKEKTLKSTSLELKKSADSCAVGATLTLSASKVTYTYSDDSKTEKTSDFPTIKWSSADTSIATVNDSGVVTGVKAGKTKIKGTIEGDGGTSTEVEVEITEAKDLALTLDKTSGVTINVGSTTTLVATVVNYKSDSGVTWSTSDSKVATVDDKGVVTGVSAGSVTITATTKEKNKSDKNVTATCTITVGSNAANDKTTKLKDKNGNQIYIKSDGNYVEAVYADYFTASDFYIKSEAKYTYTGWQTIDGKTYYYDKNGNAVTGTQIIQGVTYNFGTDGAIASSVNGTTFGIDVSRHNGTIDWNAVKASGVDFVIIRCGYRGSSTGALIEDQNFKTNIKGATAAGLKVGVYVFSQAINEVEAVKEASLAVSLVKGYSLTYPIFIDTESSGGRADNIDKATRTAVVNAFCQTISAAGYKPGIYASKTWYEDKLNMSSIGNYKIWVAQYAANLTYKSKYDMWQYSCKGKISGINGNVDLNYSYLGY
jgi:GH25 family lysozyme M1 (1,4-beta-N-acetylmuramidase)/uncharacterized protein YjdB